MKIHTRIPYVSVPCGIMLLLMSAAAWFRGLPAEPSDYAPRVVWMLLGLYFLVTGATKLRHPYIVTDHQGITIYGRAFSNRMSQQIPWQQLRGHGGRTFTNMILLRRDGQKMKIPINGITAASMSAFLKLVETETRDANIELNGTGDPPGGSPAR